MAPSNVVLETQGLSPKATAASAAALIAPLVARLVAQLLGIEIENEVAEGLILAAIAGVSALFAAWRARPGRIVAVPKLADESGYAEARPVIVIVLVILVFLVLYAVTGSVLISLLALLLLLLLL